MARPKRRLILPPWLYTYFDVAVAFFTCLLFVLNVTGVMCTATRNIVWFVLMIVQALRVTVRHQLEG